MSIKDLSKIALAYTGIPEVRVKKEQVIGVVRYRTDNYRYFISNVGANMKLALLSEEKKESKLLENLI